MRSQYFIQSLTQLVDVLCVDWWKIQMRLVIDFDEISVNHAQDAITCTQIYKLMDTFSILLRETQLAWDILSTKDTLAARIPSIDTTCHLCNA